MMDNPAAAAAFIRDFTYQGQGSMSSASATEAQRLQGSAMASYLADLKDNVQFEAFLDIQGLSTPQVEKILNSSGGTVQKGMLTFAATKGRLAEIQKEIRRIFLMIPAIGSAS